MSRGLLFRIIRHELRALRADGSAWMVAALICAMTAVAVFNVAAQFRRQQEAEQRNIRDEAERFRAYQAEAAEIERRAAARGEAPPQFEPDMVKAPSAKYGVRDAIYVGMWNALIVVPPLSPSMVLATGQSDLYPSSYKLGLEGRLEWQARGRVVQQIENPLFALVGRFDLAFVVLYLYPLLILGVSFNMVAGEKDSQTLSLLLSQPAGIVRLVIGKVLARGSLVFGCMCGFSFLFLAVSGVIGSPARILLWMLALLVYGLFWFALAIAANALGRSAAATALVLAIGWLVLLFVIPSAIHFTATALYPVPPRIAYINQVRTEENEARRHRIDLVRQYIETHPEMAAYGWNPDNLGVGFPKVPEAMPMYIEGIEIQKRLQPVVQYYEAQLQRQQALADRTRYLSPAVLMQSVLYDLAGTGRARYEHFLNQLNRFSEVWHRFFVSKLFHREMVNAPDYDRIPRFTYHEETLGPIAGRIRTPLLALFAAGVILSAFGLLAYRWYPVVR